MSKSVAEILGFKRSIEDLYTKDLVNEAKEIFNELPFKNIGIRPLILEKAVFDEALAISTAEDSLLTPENAQKIQISSEQEERILKYRKNSQLTDQEKYEQLEFENIRAVENQFEKLSFQDLTVELICNLHHDLTLGLDDYAKKVGVSNYHSGELRKSNEVKIGKFTQYIPPDFQQIEKFLGILFAEFSEKKRVELVDILEFHLLFYAIHPFQNGNKRVVRFLESMFLNYYGFSAGRTISLSVYYVEKRNETNFLLLQSLNKKDFSPFLNFAIYGYFSAGYRLSQEMYREYFKYFKNNFEVYIKQKIKALHQKNYQNAIKAIQNLDGKLTHTDFVNQMKKYGCTLGVSQMIIKKLSEDKILQKEKSLYYFGRLLDLYLVVDKMLTFFIVNNLALPDVPKK